MNKPQAIASQDADVPAACEAGAVNVHSENLLRGRRAP